VTKGIQRKVVLTISRIYYASLE